MVRSAKWVQNVLSYLTINLPQFFWQPSFRLMITAAGHDGSCLPQSLKTFLVSASKNSNTKEQTLVRRCFEFPDQFFKPSREAHNNKQIRIPILQVDFLVNGFPWADYLPQSVIQRWFVYMFFPLIALNYWFYCIAANVNLLELSEFFAAFILSAAVAAGLAINRRLLRFYVKFIPHNELLPYIPSSVIENRDDRVFVCRYTTEESLYESLVELEDTLILHDVDLLSWRTKQIWFTDFNIPLRQAWRNRISTKYGNKNNRYLLSKDTNLTSDLLWSLTRFSVMRMLVEWPLPHNQKKELELTTTDGELHTRVIEQELLLPFKLHLTQLKVYLLLIAAVFIFGICEHYLEHKAEENKETALEMKTYFDSSVCVDANISSSLPLVQRAVLAYCPASLENSYFLNASETIQGNSKTNGILKIPIDAFSKALLMHGTPILLGGLGLLWIAMFIRFRHKQHSFLKSWFDRPINKSRPLNYGEVFFLRHDLNFTQQWERIDRRDLHRSLEQFGPSDEKIWHLVESVLLVLFFEVIHLVH